MKIALSLLLYLLSLPIFGYGESTSHLRSQGREARGIAIRPIDSLYYTPLEMQPLLQEGKASGAHGDFGYLNAWMGRQTKLVVGSAPSSYRVVVNGKQVASGVSGATPSEFNVTRELQQGRNSVEILYVSDPATERVEGWNSKYRGVEDVYLVSQPTLHVSDVWQRTTLVGSEMVNVTVGVALSSTALGLQQGRIDYSLLSPSWEVLTSGSRDVQAQLRGCDTITLSVNMPISQLWSEQQANIHTLSLVNRRGGRVLERLEFEIGLRSVDYLGESIWVNGEPTQLKAKRVAADISIEELESLRGKGYNTFVLSAGRYNEKVYRWADSRGLYIIATAAVNSSKSGDDIRVGGNVTNDSEYRDLYIERAEDLYRATQFHPSVMGFAIAEESLNGDNLYHSYLYLKAKGDSRPVVYFDGAGEWNSDNIDILWE